MIHAVKWSNYVWFFYFFTNEIHLRFKCLNTVICGISSFINIHFLSIFWFMFNDTLLLTDLLIIITMKIFIALVKITINDLNHINFIIILYKCFLRAAGTNNICGDLKSCWTKSASFLLWFHPGNKRRPQLHNSVVPVIWIAF